MSVNPNQAWGEVCEHCGDRILPNEGATLVKCFDGFVYYHLSCYAEVQDNDDSGFDSWMGASG